MVQLGVVEKKLLGALISLADRDMIVEASIDKIVKTMGYKTRGGAITYALKLLEINNYIDVLENGKIRVLL